MLLRGMLGRVRDNVQPTEAAGAWVDEELGDHMDRKEAAEWSFK